MKTIKVVGGEERNADMFMVDTSFVNKRLVSEGEGRMREAWKDHKKKGEVRESHQLPVGIGTGGN